MVLAGLALAPRAEAASFLTFTDRGAFESLLGPKVVEGYDSPGYQHGDVIDLAGFDVFTDAAMSAVFGETIYHTTGFANFNVVAHNPINQYGTGNGSFQLGFKETSVGTAQGVYGVGFNFLNGAGVTPNLTDPFTAFITFGDGTAINYLLPLGLNTMFFGVVSSELVSSIHLGLPDGVATQGGRFHVDDLTIGPAAVPEPGSLLLLASGLVGIVLRRRRR